MLEKRERTNGNAMVATGDGSGFGVGIKNSVSRGRFFWILKREQRD